MHGQLTPIIHYPHWKVIDLTSALSVIDEKNLCTIWILAKKIFLQASDSMHNALFNYAGTKYLMGILF